MRITKLIINHNREVLLEGHVCMSLREYDRLNDLAKQAMRSDSLVIKTTSEYTGMLAHRKLRTEYLHKEDAISDIEKMYEIARAEIVSDFEKKLKEEIDSLEKMSLICFLRKRFFTKSK